MNIEIRRTIRLALREKQAQAALSFDCHADIDKALAWLDAQPEATERWEPVADINRMSGTFIRPDDTSTPLRGLSILSEDGRICIDWRDGGVEVDLPADLRLCRRVEVQP